MRKKIVTIVGARPQFVKAAALSPVLREVFQECLVHTGQHFSEEMSGSLFAELSLPEPDYHLGIHSLPHGAMTGRMVEGIEGILFKEKPDALLVFGDTDSTLAGSLAAAKLGIPIAHVEAGLRSYRKEMAEEINRRVCDHLSTFHFCPTQQAINNLLQEGIQGGILSGDIMIDAAIRFCPPAKPTNPYYLATLHRAENVDCKERLQGLLQALNEADLPVLLPLHPRTKKRIEEFSIPIGKNIRLLPPQGYGAMLSLQREAKAIATDSGGMQKEAYFFHTPCVVMREETEWTELSNQLLGSNVELLPDKLTKATFDFPRGLFGTGNAANIIVDTLNEHL